MAVPALRGTECAVLRRRRAQLAKRFIDRGDPHVSLQACIECGHRVSTSAKTCPECGQPKPTRPRTSAGRGLALVLLTLGLFAASVGAGAAVRWYVESGPAASAGPSDGLQPMVPAVAPTTFPRLPVQLARSGSSVLVSNVGDQAWTGCTVDINAGVPGGAFSGELGDVKAGARVSLHLTTFRRADGRAFDPGAERVQVVDLHCDTPDGPAHFTGGP